MEFQGKTAVVTGGASGMGLLCAQNFYTNVLVLGCSSAIGAGIGCLPVAISAVCMFLKKRR